MLDLASSEAKASPVDTGISSTGNMTTSNYLDLRSLPSWRCSEVTKQFDIGSVLTSLATSQLPKDINEQWTRLSKETEGVPDIKLLLEFLNDHVNSIASTSSVLVKSDPPREPTKRSYKTSIHSVQTSQPRDRLDSCSACRGEHHPLYQCGSFMSMSVNQRQQHVRTPHHLCF